MSATPRDHRWAHAVGRTDAGPNGRTDGTDTVTHSIVINGSHTELGRRVAQLMRDDSTVTTCGVDSPSSHNAAKSVAAAHTLIVLAPGSDTERDGSSVGGVDVALAERLLHLADAGHLRQVVLLSSAMVYGAWPDNPVPITEDQAVRPNPGSSFACDKAELERVVTEWCEHHPGVRLAVLRPTLVVSEEPEAVEWMERSLWHTASARFGDVDPPRQFLLLDDLARAIDHVRRKELDGVYNVAPDGWLAVAPQIELTGRPATTSVRVPEALAEGVAETRWKLQLTSTPPDVLPFTMYPWVVSSDRLRATGWHPGSSNEEAFVAGHRERWWASLSARRRQEIALGAMVGGIVVAGGATYALVRRLLRS